MTWRGAGVRLGDARRKAARCRATAHAGERAGGKQDRAGGAGDAARARWLS